MLVFRVVSGRSKSVDLVESDLAMLQNEYWYLIFGCKHRLRSSRERALQSFNPTNPNPTGAGFLSGEAVKDVNDVEAALQVNRGA